MLNKRPPNSRIVVKETDTLGVNEEAMFPGAWKELREFTVGNRPGVRWALSSICPLADRLRKRLICFEIQVPSLHPLSCPITCMTSPSEDADPQHASEGSAGTPRCGWCREQNTR